MWAELWHYTPSFDGRKHWLNLTAESAEVRTPEGVFTSARWPGQQPPTLFVVCEEGGPLDITVAFNATEAPTASWVSLRNLWAWLTGTDPAPHIFPTTITLGSAVVETTFGLPAVSYLEPDYIAALDGPGVVAALLATGELGLRSTGQIQMDARFRLPADYREQLRKLAQKCPSE